MRFVRNIGSVGRLRAHIKIEGPVRNMDFQNLSKNGRIYWRLAISILGLLYVQYPGAQPVVQIGSGSSWSGSKQRNRQQDHCDDGSKEFDYVPHADRRCDPTSVTSTATSNFE